MSVLQFLKSNAMQFAGGAQVGIGVILAFTHLTAAQVAVLATVPTGIGTFLAGLVITTQSTSAARATPTPPTPPTPPPTPPPPPTG